jgi:hypothetical protein
MIETNEAYTLQANNDGVLVVCILDKNPSDIADLNDFTSKYLMRCNSVTPQTVSPFSAKKIGGKGLFKRIHGIKYSCIAGVNIIEFIIPYDVVKITGLEIINATALDTCDFEIYDRLVNPISGVSGVKLNQFGFSVVVSKDYYEHSSEYDADLYKDMKIVIRHTASSVCNIGINFILNELK